MVCILSLNWLSEHVTANVDVAVHVVTRNNEIVNVLVVFDNHQVGLKAIQSSQYRSSFPTAVPLVKHEVVFLARGKKGSEVTRVQFPLTLA